MSITVSCTGCQANLRLRDEHAGKKIRCPKCKGVVQVPATPGDEEIIATELAPEADMPAAPAPRPMGRRPMATQPCPHCGAHVPVQAQRCPQCGAGLGADDGYEEEEERPRVTRGKYVPCPKCGGTDIKKVKYTFWGSVYGPKLFHHVRCLECDYAYNGKTGGSNLVPAILFVVIPLIGIIGLLAFIAYIVIARSTPT